MNDSNQTPSSQQNTNQTTGGIFGTPLADVSNTPTVSDTAQNQLNPVSTSVPQSSEQDVPVAEDIKQENQVLDIPNFETQDSFSQPKETTEEFKDLGVSVIDTTPIEDTHNIFSKESAFVSSDKEHKTLPKQEPLSAEPLNPSHPPLDTKSLEQDFSQTFNTSVANSSQPGAGDPLFLEEERLKKLHQDLKDKASSKKQEVKQKLEQLKKEKEDLGHALSEIKEIEEIAAKIEEKLSALKTIDTDLDSLEAKAREELN